MRRRVAVVALALFGAACRSESCVEPLRARPGSDTAAALAAAIDTLRRGESGTEAWVPTSYVRRAGDTAEVVASPRCWRHTDEPYARVRVVPPARVVDVWIQMGG